MLGVVTSRSVSRARGDRPRPRKAYQFKEKVDHAHTTIPNDLLLKIFIGGATPSTTRSARPNATPQSAGISIS